MAAKQVKVYSTPTCPWCLKTKKFLDDNKVAFQNLDVASDKQAREEMVKKSGQLVVPQVEIDGDLKIGYDEGWLRQKLDLTS
ncbi:MAG: glutaredoxin domain-containing protein [Dehalococcoidia bacterium]|nr:glutaredoxin domain-containing protein [Dehalococcoidia bacterium]